MFVVVENKVEKKLSCLGGGDDGDSGGLDSKKLLLLLLLLLFFLLLLLILFELKDIRISFNGFNLLCILISTVFGVFFIRVLATCFLPM